LRASTTNKAFGEIQKDFWIPIKHNIRILFKRLAFATATMMTLKGKRLLFFDIICESEKENKNENFYYNAAR
jgi:hypothetical protein